MDFETNGYAAGIQVGDEIDGEWRQGEVEFWYVHANPVDPLYEPEAHWAHPAGVAVDIRTDDAVAQVVFTREQLERMLASLNDA